MNSQDKGKFVGPYSQRVLTPDEFKDYQEQERLDNDDIGLTDLGIDYSRQEPQGRPPIKPQSRSQWAPRRTSQLTRQPRYPRTSPLTDPNGPNPMYYNPDAYAEFTDDKGTTYKDPNIFPPNRQGDLPHQFAPMPVGVNEIDQTPMDVQRQALDAFAPDPYTLKHQYSPPFAPISPAYSSSSSYPSSPGYQPNYATEDAHKGVVKGIGDWLNNMGKGGKTRKRKGKRKTNRKMKSKKSKKSRRR